MTEISNKTVAQITFKKTLPELKDQAHKYFDMIWKLGYMERNELYVWFASWLGVEEPKAHMSKMNEDLCKKVIEGSIMILNDMRRLDLDFSAPIKHPYYELV
jgi:hypothetical protein